ncbi:MAG: Fic family protein [Actinobacteria bacterium]|nr:Fic family protein [Actinomycetota bacterium]
MKAAALAESIIRPHPFVDGNKRTATKKKPGRSMSSRLLCGSS